VKIIFWDIDGTLVRTGKAGLYAFEEAVAELWSVRVDFSKIGTAGATDYSIASEIIRTATGRAAQEAEVVGLTRRYEELLEQHLEKREGWVLPSILDILESLQDSGFKSLLLTGNSRRGAELKMKKFDLEHFFDFDLSAFCENSLIRDEVALRALQKARSLAGTDSPEVFVIGDTPNDIRCGKSIGAYTIGVSTGTFSLEELLFHCPWWAVEQLPAAAEFLSKINFDQAGE